VRGAVWRESLKTAMPKKKKLELMNHRFFYKDQNNKIYDSCEDFRIPTFIETTKQHHYDFDSQFGRDKVKPKEIYHSNEIFDPPHLNRTGEPISITDCLVKDPHKTFVTDRLDNSYEHIYNDAAAIFSRAQRYTSSTKEVSGFK
jgi:hypothetical protein